MKKQLILSLLLVFALGVFAPSIVSAMDNDVKIVKVDGDEKKVDTKKAATKTAGECTGKAEAKKDAACTDKAEAKKGASCAEKSGCAEVKAATKSSCCGSKKADKK